MKKICFLSTILALLFGMQGFSETVQQGMTKKRVIADLQSIRNIFEVKYAPLKWKGEYAAWNLDQAFEDAKARIHNLSNPTLKECQAVVRDFFMSAKDYHVGVRFYSTESATLPFFIKGANGRYFVTYVDRTHVSKKEFPFEVGDEILSFDGKPIQDQIEALKEQEFGKNTSETDEALAEYALTHRRRELGMSVPKGVVVITGKEFSTNKPLLAKLNWAYSPEKIQDYSHLGKNLMTAGHVGQKESTVSLAKSSFFDKYMVAHFWDKSSLNCYLDSNKHSLGSRSSFIPSLGKKVWQSGSDSLFDAYIFKSPSGKNVGYIRIPHYIGDEEEVEEFGLLMNYFQKRTDALVIDQINNPGGSVFYLYGLASTLADKPFYTPKHHIALTQDEVHTAVQLLTLLEPIKDDARAREAFGENLGGYPVDYEFVKLTRQFCEFLIGEWNQGKVYTDPTFLFGVDSIRPHPEYAYHKPILLVINSLDFSGGDFFPAILQDNKRATLFGVRTAGAGGYVLNSEFPNHSGIRNFLVTGSLAERIDKKPIENLGVQPDLPYELSVADLTENYQEYVAAIVEAVESLANK